jgi:hypothetical protein
VEEYSHAGLAAFRVGGRKFASLASQVPGYGNLMLTLGQQSAFVEEAPEIFLPIPGGWGRWATCLFSWQPLAKVYWQVRFERRGICESIRTQRQAARIPRGAALRTHRQETRKAANMRAPTARDRNRNKQYLSPEQREELLGALKARFERNMHRHKSLDWGQVRAKLEANAERVWSLNEMERTAANRT